MAGCGSGVHWNTSPFTDEFVLRKGVDAPVDDLSAGFNTWGCLVTKERQVFYFNGQKVGQVDSPSQCER